MHSQNHGKPVYKKTVQVDGLDVMLYFWDERDGANFCGWWFGPKVGGDQVWCYHPDKACLFPPQSGWKILYNGPVDQTLSVTPHWGAAPAASASAALNPQQAALEQKRQQELAKRQQQLKTAQEMQQKRMEEQAKQTATLNIRRVIQKIRSATAETIDLVIKELDVVKAKDLEACGNQKQIIITECEKAVQQGRQKIELEKKAKLELQQKQLQAQQQLEERKKQMEENKKKIEENKLKLAEDLKRQKQEAIEKRAEEVKKAREAALKKIEDDKKAKVEAEERKLKEQQTAIALRKVAQKVRVAKPEEFEEARKELEEAMAKDFENCGAQKELIKTEVDKIIEQATARFDKFSEQRRAQMEKKDAAMKLCSELEELVQAAESAVVKLKESAAFFEDGSELSVADVEEISQVIQEGVLESSIRTKACNDFVLQNLKDMKDPLPLQPGQTLEVKETAEKLRARIKECTVISQATFKAAQDAKDKALRQAWALDKQQEITGIFTKYCNTFENLLTSSEIAKFTQEEFNYTVPQKVLDTIFTNIVEEGAKGVHVKDFHFMKAAIGIAREQERDAKRRKDLEKAKEDTKASIEEMELAVGNASKVVNGVERQVLRLVGKVSTLPVVHMFKLADKTDEMVAQAKSTVGSISERVSTVKSSLTGGLKDTFAAATLKLEKETKHFELRLVQAERFALRFRESANKKQTLEAEKFRIAVLKIIRYNQRLKSLNVDDLFNLFDAEGVGSVTSEAFVKFFETADKNVKSPDDEPDDVDDVDSGAGGAKEDDLADVKSKIKAQEGTEEDEDDLGVAGEEEAEGDAADLGDEFSPAALAKLFSLFAAGERSLPKEDFLRIIRVFYKCVKETMATDGMSLKDSKPVRRVEVNEVAEILEGPIKDDSFGVMRVQARMLKDGAEGWISIAGNRGTVFLKRGGNMYKVVRETFLSRTIQLDDDASSMKKLPVGEVLEMHEVPRLEAVSGLTRMKAKVKSDGTIGWVTTMESPKNVFVKVL